MVHSQVLSRLCSLRIPSLSCQAVGVDHLDQGFVYPVGTQGQVLFVGGALGSIALEVVAFLVHVTFVVSAKLLVPLDIR